ncbi:MAG: DUF433 domain-containing protein [Deltaproteobacteria bacterium]|nr:DUF433 domain-containing protein [Deltaproteobacteria bacterium]
MNQLRSLRSPQRRCSRISPGSSSPGLPYEPPRRIGYSTDHHSAEPSGAWDQVPWARRGEDAVWRDRIVVDVDVLVGKPVVKGTRLTVEFIVELLSQGWTYEQILDNYPGLTRQDILACLSYASNALHAEKIYPLAEGGHRAAVGE